MAAVLPSAAEAQNVSGRWRLGSATVTFSHIGSRLTGRDANGRVFLTATQSGKWFKGRAFVAMSARWAQGRCPQYRAHWAPIDMIIAENGRKLVGRQYRYKFNYTLRGGIRCWKTGGIWQPFTFVRLGGPVMPPPIARPSCSTCARALCADLRYGLGRSAAIVSYAHQARTNYANCVRRVPGSCNGTGGSLLYANLWRSCQGYARQWTAYRSCVATLVRGRC